MDEGAAPETAGAVQQGPAVVRGFLVLGPEVRSIKPCGEEQELWVIPLTEVTEAYDALSREPYSPVFVEVEGELTKVAILVELLDGRADLSHNC